MSFNTRSVSTANHTTLPQESAIVEVQILDGGTFTANASKVIEGAADYNYIVPDWAFLVRDCESGRVLLWDYGLSEVSIA